MKDEIKNLLEIVKHTLDGIQDAIKSGDDGLISNIDSQVSQLKKELNLWVDTTYPKKEISQIKDSIDYSKLQDSDNGKDQWAAKMYFFIKRKIREDNTIADITDRSDIANHINCYIIELNDHNTKMFFEDYVYTGLKIVDDVVNEIIEHRNTHKQTNLF